MRFDPAAAAAASLASGVLLGLSVPPGPLAPAAGLAGGVALVPLLAVWDRADSARVALLAAYGTHLAAAALAFRWPLAHEIPGAAAASLGAWLLLPLLLALPWAAAVPLRRRLGRGAGLTALGAFVLLAEGLLARGPWAFPWPLLGHTLAATPLAAQAADLLGVPGLSLGLFVLNACAFLAVLGRGRTRVAASLGALALLGGAAGYGAWRLDHLPPPPSRHLDVAYLQPALGAFAWADVRDRARVDTLLALTRPALAEPPPDLVVWPETALPVLRLDGPLARRLSAWADSQTTALLTGAILDAGGAYENAAVLFRPDAAPVRYAKRRLVPFAEAVPFADRLPGLGALGVDAGGVPGYRRGAGRAAVLPGPDASGASAAGPLGIMICLESVFGLDARRAARAGAGAFVVLTQDGWWGPSAAPRQHLAFTRLRAIETRRAVLQVAVSGISGLVLPDGRLVQETGWMERRLERVRLPLTAPQTLFLRLGDVVTPAALLVALGLLLAARRRRPRPMPDPPRPNPLSPNDLPLRAQR